MKQLASLAVRAKVFRALGHPLRLAIIELLADGNELCVSEIQMKTGVPQSTVSKHLAVLRRLRIVSCSKSGLNVAYKLRMKCVYRFMECAGRVLARNDDGKMDPECEPCACRPVAQDKARLA